MSWDQPVLTRLEARLTGVTAWLQELPAWRFVLNTVVATLAVVSLVFPPRLYIWCTIHNHQSEWTRGLNFLMQCQMWLSPKIEPALQWRLLPGWIGHELNYIATPLPLFISPIGLICLLVYFALTLERLTNRLVAFLGTIFLGTSSAIITPCDWIGINDPWAWLCLVVAAFSRKGWALPLVCLLGPWIDERFIIALPLALLIRHREDSLREHVRSFVIAGVLLAPYILLRIYVVLDPSTTDQYFLRGTMAIFSHWLPFAPLAFWLSYRLIWLAMIFALIKLNHWRFWVVVLLTLLVPAILAADLTRSPADLLPLAVLGIVAFYREWPQKTGVILITLLTIQVAIPYAHISNYYVIPVLPLPFEIFRYFTNHT